MPASATVLKAAALVGGLSRDRDPDDPEYIAARRDLGEAILAEKIRQTVAKFGPLTDEQRARLALLLAPTASRSRASAA